ncbi:MAG TPA: RNA-binding cell elongation regulator Jag/EloR [Solirubrobacterales bacterium]|nr:RNA-binding cell elongation regulator Jag/EloR [Solirubrobacterales bacterium]
MGTEEATPDAPAEIVRSILERVVETLGVEASVEVEESDRQITGIIDGEDVGRLIGRRGQTIDAVQFICYRAAQRGSTDRKRVIVDAGGYRERRREQLEDQAGRAAARASEAGKEIELEPMTPSERKVIHDYLAERSGIETFSEGDEPDRCVIVAPLVESNDDA